jgi:hypothetical protein
MLETNNHSIVIPCKDNIFIDKPMLTDINTHSEHYVMFSSQGIDLPYMAVTFVKYFNITKGNNEAFKFISHWTDFPDVDMLSALCVNVGGQVVERVFDIIPSKVDTIVYEIRGGNIVGWVRIEIKEDKEND